MTAILMFVALAMCIVGAIVGFPPTVTLAFPEGSTTVDEVESAIRARNRGVLIFFLGAALGALAVFIA